MVNSALRVMVVFRVFLMPQSAFFGVRGVAVALSGRLFGQLLLCRSRVEFGLSGTLPDFVVVHSTTHVDLFYLRIPVVLSVFPVFLPCLDWVSLFGITYCHGIFFTHTWNFLVVFAGFVLYTVTTRFVRTGTVPGFPVAGPVGFPFLHGIAAFVLWHCFRCEYGLTNIGQHRAGELVSFFWGAGFLW